MRIVHWVYFIALLTASCDVAFVLNIGFVTLRLCEILLLFVMIAAAAVVMQSGTILWPKGGNALVLWCTLQMIFALRSVNPGPSLQFFALLMLPILGVFAALQLYGRSQWIERLVKAYLISFVMIAGFGVFQFAAPLLHLGSPFIEQWIVYGLIARVNGFSFEPSFFATYMVLGWIALIELRISKARIVSGRLWFWLTCLVSLALFLSTSKTGWAVMILEGCARLLPGIVRTLVRHARRIRGGDLRFQIPTMKTTIGVAAGIAAIAVITYSLGSVITRVVDPNIFLAGSGINDASSHSIDKRSQDLQWTLLVIRENPWIGVSLGGVAGRIAQLMGDPFSNTAAIKTHWGFPVPVEVFAASGLVGFIPFVWFFLEITLGQRRLLKEHPSDERSKWLRALVRALIFEWFCLAADQNLVRMYLWFHVAILIIVAYNLRFGRSATQATPRLIAV